MWLLCCYMCMPFFVALMAYTAYKSVNWHPCCTRIALLCSHMPGSHAPCLVPDQLKMYVNIYLTCSGITWMRSVLRSRLQQSCRRPWIGKTPLAASSSMQSAGQTASALQTSQCGTSNLHMMQEMRHIVLSVDISRSSPVERLAAS